ncbi:unnamed protein product [Effrenium voratum]|uniref:Uncharacterized protein n=1 Tax=Effrenium voratum TaxID=2562239 RepID=A0AA36JTS4_9DINO|nr:unnamed protein product [Effrenium voratum]
MGYTVRKDWVNGPNSVFRFVLGSFYEGNFSNYDAFYFMELDAVPVQPWWLEQFVGEALYYPRAAIRGSRYRDTITFSPCATSSATLVTGLVVSTASAQASIFAVS